ncbi:MAG: site-specific DNA-methyltransferase [Anaerolineae bacterium]|nr:site-specific DNA-methyltransferase [Anaerolineae bacterium]
MSLPKLRPTFTFDAERLAALKAIAPEAFADGKVNWEVLREALGDVLEDEGRDAEPFGLTWHGKRAARRLASTPSAGTLLPAPGEGVNEATTRNLFIEGDNLEVLKLLQKSYAGRVKLIYIDPPYNTGNDFIYSDNFTQPLEEYLRATGQADEAGRVLVTNTRASGRFHANWLNMMYPRLRLARTLLREDGALFVSIDDNEVHHLRMILNEIFGEENFVVQIPWQSRLSVQNDTDISVNHEYILVYAKLRRQSERRLKESNADKWYSLPGFAAYPLPLNPERFSNPDNDPRGPWKADPFDAPNLRPNLTYPITNPNTGEIFLPPPGRHWRVEREKFEALLSEGRIVFGHSGTSRPQLKVFYEEKKDFGEVPTSWFDGSTYGTTTSGTQELQALFDGKAVFDNPKPTKLLKALLQLAARGEDIVMDFFAGSCTLAQAVLEYNRENHQRCRFICVQIPEPVPEDSLAYPLGYRTVSDIGKERIRRVIARLQAERQSRLDLESDHSSEDLGFRVFKLGRSHYKAWQDYQGDDMEALQQCFDRFTSPLVEDWKPENLLVEVMLLEGFPLDSTVEPLSAFPYNKVWKVASESLAHRLYVCLDEQVHDETIAALRLDGDDLFVCLDSALSDEAKVRLLDGRSVKVI